MQWAKKRGELSIPRAISGTAFMPTIYSLLSWNSDCRYRITGIRRGNGSDAVLLFNLEETEIFIPSDVIDEQQISDEQPDVKPFTDNLKKNVRAYPPDWADTFGSNYYCHAQAQELAGFDDQNTLSSEAIAYKDSDIQVTSPDEVEKNIEQLMSDMKENRNE